MAYGSAVAFNATNPLSPMLIIALLSPIAGLSAPSWEEAAMLFPNHFKRSGRSLHSAWRLCYIEQSEI